MRILVIEDEASIQDRIVRLSKKALGDQLKNIQACDSIDEGLQIIKSQIIDLLLLDLNLNGKDGFDVLREVVSQSFHTVVISAYPERAIEAYDLGVLDFITKPFDELRLKKAFDRVSGKTRSGRDHFAKFLAIRKFGLIELFPIDQINYIRADGGYSQLYMLDDRKEMHDKMLKDLCELLPTRFERVHKSYIVNMNQVKGITSKGSHKHFVILQNDIEIPLSRSKYKELKTFLNI
jgi:two-component system, LytTR family, response regulator LytT